MVTETIAAVNIIHSMGLKLGKTTIVAGERTGFVLNNLLAFLIEFLMCAMMIRADPEDIEKAYVDFGFPTGPLRIMDEVCCLITPQQAFCT